jgi:hypothetical protein
MTGERKHNEENEKQDRLGETLRRALPPLGPAELHRDLWPHMRERLNGSQARTFWQARVPWFDWALLGVAAVAMLFFPALFPALLYHL